MISADAKPMRPVNPYRPYTLEETSRRLLRALPAMPAAMQYAPSAYAVSRAIEPTSAIGENGTACSFTRAARSLEVGVDLVAIRPVVFRGAFGHQLGRLDDVELLGVGLDRAGSRVLGL